MSVISGNTKSTRGGYQIARSLRLRQAASAKLAWTPGVAPASAKKYTQEFWLKRGKISDSALQPLYAADSTGYDLFGFDTDDTLRWWANANANSVKTAAVYRDPSAWLHIVLRVDTDAASGSRLIIEVNGVVQSLQAWSTEVTPAQTLKIAGSGKVQQIGREVGNNYNFFDGYLASFRHIDGQALAASNFGQTNATTGAWEPKAYSGSYGTNGFYLKFSDNSGITPATIGKDSSGTNVLSTTGTTASSTALTAIAGAVQPQVNQIVTGSGIPSNTYLTVVGGVSGAWTATMSAAATTTVVGGALVFTGNNWTPSGISVAAGVTNDSLVDTPTNYGTDTGAGGEVRGNYCTWNPLDKAAGVALTGGNLDAAWSGASITQATRSTFALSDTVDQYWEVGVNTNSNSNALIGVADARSSLAALLGGDAYGWAFSPAYNGSGTRGAKLTNNPTGAPGGTVWGKFATAFGLTVYGFYWKALTREIFIRDDTGWMNASNSNDSTPTTAMYSSIAAGTLFPAVGHYSGASQSTAFSINAGQRPFAYTAPSGSKALCTQNLPDPAILKPNTYFDVVTITGTGAAVNIPMPSGMISNFAWLKDRSNGSTNHLLINDLAINGNTLSSNNTAAEVTSSAEFYWNGTPGVNVLAMQPFSLNAGITGRAYVVAGWKKGATPGFDIVSYTGTGSARTVAHSLGVAPKMIIVKGRNTTTPYGWFVYHSGLTSANYRLELQSTGAQANGGASGQWNSTDPTSSVFSLGGSSWPEVNENTKSYIAYLFAEISGFSKFGSYTGNGSTDGPFVYCGFRPRWVMWKSASTGGWGIVDAVRDTYNVSANVLVPSSSAADSTATNLLDITSNGFKIRHDGSSVNLNQSGQTFVFAAFAEQPFKTARAR